MAGLRKWLTWLLYFWNGIQYNDLLNGIHMQQCPNPNLWSQNSPQKSYLISLPWRFESFQVLLDEPRVLVGHLGHLLRVTRLHQWAVPPQKKKLVSAPQTGAFLWSILLGMKGARSAPTSTNNIDMNIMPPSAMPSLLVLGAIPKTKAWGNSSPSQIMCTHIFNQSDINML